MIPQCYLIGSNLALYLSTNLLPGHGSKGILSHSKDMWVHVTHGLATIGCNDVWAIQRQLLIWVNSNQYNTYMYSKKNHI